MKKLLYKKICIYLAQNELVWAAGVVEFEKQISSWPNERFSERFSDSSYKELSEFWEIESVTFFFLNVIVNVEGKCK